MTSLQGSLPRSGSTLWRKDRGRLTTEDDVSAPVIKHVVIREVWQKKLPSPHALYKIDVMTKSNHWSVLRRYREFRQLHKKLMSQYGIPKDMIPPKKYTSKMLLSHLEKRKEALEHYLQRLVNSSTYVSSSPEIMEFLEVRSHDVMSVTKTLAKELFEVGEGILAKGGEFTLTPTQMYCVTRQLQLPEPCHSPGEPGNTDLGNLYGFLYQLKKLCVSNLINKVGPKQELAGHLEFDISLFKALRELRVEGCPVALIKGLSAVQSQLSHLTANYCIKTMKELLVDRVEENRGAPQARGYVESWRSHTTAKLMQNRTVVQPWLRLTHLTLRHNKLAMFDNSLKLMPVLMQLDLSYNEFVHFDLQQLACPSLTHLNLSHNDIHFVTGTPRKITHLKSLNLSYNNLEILYALDCFNGLIELDVSCNQIRLIQELSKLSTVSQLKYLSIAGNPFTRARAYRMAAFSYFTGRDIMLDKAQMSANERVKLRSYPSKQRSHSSPERVRADEDEDFQDVSPTRSYSFDIFGHPESDNDSGIEGAPSLHSDSIMVDPDDSESTSGLEFAWSYFDKGMGTSCSVDTVIASEQMEEQGVECSNQTAPAGAIAEVAIAEVAAETDTNDGDDSGNLNSVACEGVHFLGRNTSEVAELPSSDKALFDKGVSLSDGLPKHPDASMEETKEERLTQDVAASYTSINNGLGYGELQGNTLDMNDLSQALQEFVVGEQSLNDVQSIDSSSNSSIN